MFVKGYGFLSFAKNMGKNISKKKSKISNCKYSQKILDHAKQAVTYAFNTSSKSVIRKTAEATGDLTGNKISDKVTRASITSQKKKNNSETNEEETIRRKYISPELRQKLIDDLRLKEGKFQ